MLADLSRASAHARWEMAAAVGAPFVPTTDISGITAISAILDVATATLVSGDISSLPDLLNSNPAVQTVSGRRPTLELSAGNGLPCMRFATNDALSWPITAQSAGGTSQAGWGLWVKFDTASGSRTLVNITNQTGGATGTKLRIRSNSLTMQATASPDGTATKTCASGNINDSAWHFYTIEYDSTAGTDAGKLVLTVDGVSLGSISGAATLGTLFAATGNITIGNGADDVSPSSALNGLIGPNIYAFASKTAGATTGLLSTAERLALMNFEKPT